MPLFSIIIVNFNTKELTGSCIDSIFKNCFGDFEILVVDNNSSDGSTAYLNDRFGDKIKVISQKNNIGFGAANNRGAMAAGGNLLFFLNSDTFFRSDVLLGLKSFLNNKKVGIIAPTLVLADGSAQPYSCGVVPDFKSLLLGKIFKKGFRGGKKWVSGAALLIKREIFKEVGGFDEKYFMYFEDVDLCYRVGLAGYEVFVADNVKVFHLGGQSLKIKKERKIFYYKSQDYFYLKHYGFIVMLFVRFFRFFYLIFK